MVIISSLLLTGCFSSPDNGENGDNEVVEITGNVNGDGEYPVEGIEVSLSYEKEDETGIFFAWTEVDEKGQYQFVVEDHKFPEGDMVYSIGFTPDRTKETYYLSTSKDVEFNAQETKHYEVEDVKIDDGSLLHGVVKDPDGELMEKKQLKISYEYEGGEGVSEVKTNEDGEFYLGIKARDNVDVEVTASDHDDYNNPVFEDIDFKHRKKESIEVNFGQE